MDNTFTYTLRRSQRKTLAIHITKEATVEVRAPLHLSNQVIASFVLEKTPWIHRHLEEMAQRIAQVNTFSLSYGDTSLYLGLPYPIVPHTGTMGFDGNTFLLPSNWDSVAIQQGLATIYTHQAKRILPEKVDRFSKKMGVKPASCQVNGAKTRWGSCSSKKRLNFSWRLLLAQEDVVDYVVVHELAHIKHMNHSAQFWAEVATFCPDYQTQQAKLKPLANYLLNQGW